VHRLATFPRSQFKFLIARRAFVEHLLANLGDSGSIIVYSSYEKAKLNGLAAFFPDLAPCCEAVVARLIDLEKVLNEGYWHPGFAGRTSIEKVLLVLVPELSNAQLRSPSAMMHSAYLRSCVWA
jgi:hypothetical protein